MKQRVLFNFDEKVTHAFNQEPEVKPLSQDWQRMRMALDQKGLLKKSNFQLIWLLYFNASLILTALIIYGAYTGYQHLNTNSNSGKELSIENSVEAIAPNAGNGDIASNTVENSKALSADKKNLNTDPTKSTAGIFVDSSFSSTQNKKQIQRNKNSFVLNSNSTVKSHTAKRSENANSINSELAYASIINTLQVENSFFPLNNLNFQEKSVPEFGIKEYPKTDPYWAYKMYVGAIGYMDFVKYKIRADNQEGEKLLENFEEKLNGNTGNVSYSFGMQLGYLLNQASAIEVNFLYAQKRAIQTGPSYMSNSSDTSQTIQKYQYNLEATYFESQLFYKRYLNNNSLRFFISPGVGLNMNAGTAEKNYFLYESMDSEKIVKNKIVLNKSSLGVDLIARMGLQYTLSSRFTLGMEVGHQWGLSELVRKENYYNIPVSHYLRDLKLGMNLNYHFLKR